ncbi:MAG TPA: Flp family type IVb pilin [Gemmataceae bacterium]|jgi:pilus assembly protein Flp/PilA|nr:Flp family type IVb pilin [Gemmataceae bacterium]
MSRLLDVVTTAFRRRLLRKEEGASLAEYGLLLGLIALICIAAISILGTKISSMFSTLSSSM